MAQERCLHECDFSSVHYQPLQTVGTRNSVATFFDASNQTSRNKIRFQLNFGDEPVRARYALDDNMMGGDESRRTQMIVVEDEEQLAKLRALDEANIQAAIRNMDVWFKTKPNQPAVDEAEVRRRFTPIVQADPSGNGASVIKVKFKCATSAVPTKLHLRDPADGRIVPHGGTIEHLEARGCEFGSVVLSTQGIYFVGSTKWGMSFQVEECIVTPAKEPLPLANLRFSRGAAKPELKAELGGGDVAVAEAEPAPPPSYVAYDGGAKRTRIEAGVELDGDA